MRGRRVAGFVALALALAAFGRVVVIDAPEARPRVSPPAAAPRATTPSTLPASSRVAEEAPAPEPDLARPLPDVDPAWDRADRAEALAARRDVRHAGALAALLCDPDPTVRLVAARGLEASGEIEALPAVLAARATEGDERVRRALDDAAQALGPAAP